jgi:hypothetical protein
MQGPEDRIPDSEVPLRLTSGHASGLQITLAALACALIIGMMIYGLNQPTSEGNLTGSAPQTTGTGAPATPQAGGNVPGGENAAPKAETAPQDQPAQQPVPQQQKPGVTEDDSKR